MKYAPRLSFCRKRCSLNFQAPLQYAVFRHIPGTDNALLRRLWIGGSCFKAGVGK